MVGALASLLALGPAAHLPSALCSAHRGKNVSQDAHRWMRSCDDLRPLRRMQRRMGDLRLVTHESEVCAEYNVTARLCCTPRRAPRSRPLPQTKNIDLIL